jgi:small subunit ribosomal protein S20
VANIKSAKKRARQAEKTRTHNVGLRSKLRSSIKTVITAIDSKDHNAAQEAFKNATPIIDSMVNKNIIKRNKAARHKIRLNKMIKGLS